VRVLEPSPPAVHVEPWFADDPTARGDLPPDRTLVSPVTTGDLLWDELARDDDELAAWCADRWLAAHRPLDPPPPTLPTTRTALHRVAERVISPVRARDHRKIGLRWTRGGFGTPFFGADAQVRVDGGQLVIDAGGEERRHPLKTIADAAAAIGFELSGAHEEQDDAVLDIDPAAASFIGELFGFATSVLEQLRAEAAAAAEPSRVQLWPEHFDVAVELGNESAGVRAAYGVSPGDENHPEPYLYVAPWAPSERLPYAELQHAEQIAQPDQRAAALEFFRARLA
jgi:hypothetical protein